jgi:hypothetical protein
MRATLTLRRAGLAAGVMAALLLAASGCSSGGSSGPGQAAAALASVPLATTVVTAGGASYAIVDMGGAAGRQENFWQLFARPAATAAWRLATPLGVASNGGLVAAATGTTSAEAGFRPSQDLLFSPMISTSNSGTAWAVGNPLPGGLADVPGALAAGQAGQLLALTTAGAVLERSSPRAGWTRLTTLRQLAATAVGRGCGLTELTAVTFGPDGSPMLAGDCSRPRAAGIFGLTDGTWRQSGPAVSDLGSPSVSVLSLATAGSVTTVLLRVGSGPTARLAAAWLNSGAAWTQLTALTTGTAAVRSVSVWPGGSIGVVLSGSRGAVLAGQGGRWQSLTGVPAGTATLALGSGQQVEALAASGGTFRAWNLQSGSWRLAQTIRVQIPYGSSS